MRIGVFSGVLTKGRTTGPTPAVPTGYPGLVNNIPGLVSYWRLGTTASIVDEKGLHPGTYSSTPTAVAGLPTDVLGDTAVDFGGVVTGTIPHAAALALSAFSLSFWFKLPTFPTDGAVWHPISKELSGFNVGDLLVRIADNGALTIQFQDTTTDHQLFGVVEQDTVYHCCIRADGSGFSALLNGKVLGTNTVFTGALASNTNALTLGAAPFSVAPANVILDEIALYNRVLTDAEAIQLSQVEGLPVTITEPTTVPENAVTEIDVVANDIYVGSKANLTVTIVQQPTGAGHSVAVNGNNDIAYTAPAVTTDTARTFQYRITDQNGQSNVSTVNVTVLNSGAQPASNANCFNLNNPADTVTVGSGSGNIAAALQAAVNAAAPGTHILIAAGTYTGGTATFSSTGTAANPIVVRPAGARGSVTIQNANWTFANTSARLVLVNLLFTGTRIVINGDHNRISRCKFSVLGSAAIAHVTARDCRVDHCEFTQYVQDTSRKRVITWEPGGFANGTNVRNLLDYCYFHDLVYTATNLGNGNEPLSWFAQAQNMSLGPAGTVGTIDHCLFQNQEVLGEGEFISLKSGGWKVSFCTFANIAFYSQFRTGDNGEIRSCYFEATQTQAFNLFGTDHLFIGNRFVGGLNVRIAPGVATSAQVASGAVGIGSYARSNTCQIIGNRMGSGRLQIGGYWSVNPGNPDSFPTLPALNNNLFENTRDAGGDAHSFDAGTLLNGNPRHSGTTFNDPGGGAEFDYVPAVKIATPALTSSDQVGMFAPDPLCPSGPQS